MDVMKVVSSAFVMDPRLVVMRVVTWDLPLVCVKADRKAARRALTWVGQSERVTVARWVVLLVCLRDAKKEVTWAQLSVGAKVVPWAVMKVGRKAALMVRMMVERTVVRSAVRKVVMWVQWMVGMRAVAKVVLMAERKVRLMALT